MPSVNARRTGPTWTDTLLLSLSDSLAASRPWCAPCDQPVFRYLSLSHRLLASARQGGAACSRSPLRLARKAPARCPSTGGIWAWLSSSSRHPQHLRLGESSDGIFFALADKCFCVPVTPLRALKGPSRSRTVGRKKIPESEYTPLGESGLAAYELTPGAGRAIEYGDKVGVGRSFC